MKPYILGNGQRPVAPPETLLPVLSGRQSLQVNEKADLLQMEESRSDEGGARWVGSQYEVIIFQWVLSLNKHATLNSWCKRFIGEGESRRVKD